MLSVPDILLALLFLGGVAVAGNLLWKSKGSDEYFLGGRNLPWLAILASIVATETSTLTFIGAPAISYAGNVAFIQLAAGYIIGRIVVAYLILPGYFRGRYSTAYEILSVSLGEGTRKIASGVFLVTRTQTACGCMRARLSFRSCSG
jgi:SSS family solute:Na+ symporter